MIARRRGWSFAAALLIGAAPTHVDHPRTYLASIGALPLDPNERTSAFAIDTWGVEFVAVCHIPPGWRITAGESASPNGDLKGEGSHGVTWLWGVNPPELRDLVLIRLVAPVQRHDIKSGNGEVPATFKGKATVETPDVTRDAQLSYRNVRLRPARHCPPLPG